MYKKAVLLLAEVVWCRFFFFFEAWKQGGGAVDSTEITPLAQASAHSNL